MSDAQPDAQPSQAESFARHVGALIGVDRIDTLWVFPPQRAGSVESHVAVVSAYDPDPARRRVITAHRTSRRDKKGELVHQDAVVEHGVAPQDRLDRMVEGVIRRIGDEMLTAPEPHQIAGDAGRWAQFLAELPGAGG